MAKIHVLDKNIAELIAAGEVVERPASIVKELVENSVDAGSTQIRVEIKGGGIGYIRVTDNGIGISHEDISNAFLRHATSKVYTAEDLAHISTLGFRGEALSSIAAVSKVNLITKTKGSIEAYSYKIEGGESSGEVLPTGAPDGTTFIIKDIFYNTPARMKFLRSDIAEGNAVAQVIDKTALAHPEISFEFIRDGKTRLKTSGKNDLQSVISAVYDRDFADNMLKIDYTYENRVEVSGFVGNPNFSKPTRTYQNVFVNNRYVRTRTASVAVEEAFKGKIMTGRFPVCVLNVNISYESVDVNVHPAKIEVRFSQEKDIYNAVYFAVKNALSKDSQPLAENTLSKQGVTPLTLHLDDDEPVQERFIPRTTIPVYQNDTPHTSLNSSLHLSSPSKMTTEINRTVVPETSMFDKALSEIKDNLEDDEVLGDTAQSITKGAGEKAEHYEELKYIGEIFNTYILLENDNEEFILVDKHAAHERINYEIIKHNSISNNRQILLAPITVTLNRAEYSILVENLDILLKLGFLVEDFGSGTLIVRETPTVLDGNDVSSLLSEVASKMMESRRDLTPEILDRLYFSIACKSSIRGRDKNNKFELREIIKELEKNPEITHCPHGRPVSVRITRYELEKMFGRLG